MHVYACWLCGSIGLYYYFNFFDLYDAIAEGFFFNSKSVEIEMEIDANCQKITF